MSQEVPQFPIVPEADFTPEELQQRDSLIQVLSDKKLFPSLRTNYDAGGVEVTPDKLKFSLIRIGTGPNIWIVGGLFNEAYNISPASTPSRLVINTPGIKLARALAITHISDSQASAGSSGDYCKEGLEVNFYYQEDPGETDTGFPGHIIVIKDQQYYPFFKSSTIDFKAVLVGFKAFDTSHRNYSGITVCNPSTPPAVPA